MWRKVTATAITWIVMGGPFAGMCPSNRWVSSPPPSADTIPHSAWGAPSVLGTGDVARLSLVLIAGLSLTVIGLYHRRALERAPFARA